MAEVSRLTEEKPKKCGQMNWKKAIKFGRNWSGKKNINTIGIVENWRRLRKFSLVERMDGRFFERHDSSLKTNVQKESFITYVDTYDTLNKKELEKVYDDIANRTQLSYTELLSSLLELNINKLYEEVLHEIIHCIGAEKNCLNQKNIVEFAQKVFKIDQEVHEVIYKTVKEKGAPNIRLNIEVVEGKNIKPKDANGFSDPFCTFYLLSSPQNKYNTSFKRKTLRPVWKEYFSLPVLTPTEDVLCVEMWDFDPAETLMEKVGKIGDIKGMKGWKIFLHEVSSTVTNGKHNNELIGAAQIPLKEISSRGDISWYDLRKIGKCKTQGNLLLKFSFGSEKNKHVAAQEHRHLLRVLLSHQINAQRYETNSWMGEFLPKSNFIIQQHVAQSNISFVDEYLSRWAEFINVHVLSPVINFKVFLDILEKLMKPISAGQLTNEELNFFWKSTKKILPFFFNEIRTIRQKSPDNKILLLQIEHVLKILRYLSSFEIQIDLELFPSDMYGWLIPSEHTRNIKRTLHDAVVRGAEEWYLHIMENNKSEDSTEEGQIKFQIKIIKNLEFDLHRAIEFHHKLFMKKIKLPYANVLFETYERKISEMCEPFVTRICMSMTSINFEEYGKFEVENDQFAVGSSLFELYLGIQHFVNLGKIYCNVDLKTSNLIKYHLWFQQGVARWLDIATYKAMKRIEIAVELDKLKKMDSIVGHSSSAVDTLIIFFQIKYFWQQLAWPDVEGSYSFVAKIFHDVCMCSIYYSDLMDCKVNYTATGDEHFEATKEWCLAVNNIDYVKQSILPFVNELGLKQLLDDLANYKSDHLADLCGNTLNLIVENAIDILNNKLNDLLQLVVNKMSPEIDKYLIEGGDVTDPNNSNFNHLIHYLFDNYKILNSELDKEYFLCILDMQVKHLTTEMYKFIQNNLKKKNPPLHFRGLWNRFHKLYEFLQNVNESENSEIIQKLEAFLYLHTLDTVDLIQEYYLGRLKEQNEMVEATDGILTVKLLFIDNTLKVEILSAYKIKSTESNGVCDSFVKVRLLPREKFQNVIKPVTTVQKKTQCPLFDEMFEISLTSEQRSIENAMVMFAVKEQNFIGIIDEFISESFICFKDIQSTSSDNDWTVIPQIKLALTSPKSMESKPVVDALRSRITDKMAKDFLRREKIKIMKSQ